MEYFLFVMKKIAVLIKERNIQNEDWIQIGWQIKFKEQKLYEIETYDQVTPQN